jgi:hypothetical protein
MLKNITPKQLGYILGFVVLVALVLRISQIREGAAIAGIKSDIVSPVSSSSLEIASLPKDAIDEQDLIVLDSPSPSQIQARKISVSGRARGNWFFEGSFPATITDEDGNELAKASIRAQSDWMTEDMVPFFGEISIPDGMVAPSLILLHLSADDPSGGEGQTPPALTVPLQMR